MTDSEIFAGGVIIQGGTFNIADTVSGTVRYPPNKPIA